MPRSKIESFLLGMIVGVVIGLAAPQPAHAAEREYEKLRHDDPVFQSPEEYRRYRESRRRLGIAGIPNPCRLEYAEQTESVWLLCLPMKMWELQIMGSEQ